MNQASMLVVAVEAKKNELIERLLEMGVYKHHDGRDLYQLTLEELQDKFRGSDE
ncbi:Fur-regulated basic protein FbpA [Anaerobacillus alkalilacustris]|uniref:Fur-regulated basic protein FbpA n=1 Tax=Anaerobacillus alkalilacustris TaxID=393763 RepID=UPI000A04323E|nr:Fur-regulated basic protein FbpA [Anaerobacillus alkalilacustris]